METKGEFKIFCVYCNAPWDAQMLVDIEDYGAGCETCGPESSDVKLEIKCSNCKRVVYVKEGKSYDF